MKRTSAFTNGILSKLVKTSLLMALPILFFCQAGAFADDTTPPATITNLSGAPGYYEGEIKIAWSMPGDDGWDTALSAGSAIKIQRWTNVGWSTALAQITISTSGVAPGTMVAYTATGLTPGDTYYFKIWHADEAGNWSSGLSNTATFWAQFDTINPNSITDLTADAGANEGELLLSWSSPADDSHQNTLDPGAIYRIQYSSSWQIVWSTAATQNVVTVSTSGVTPNSKVSHTLTGLTGGVTYYAMVWYADNAGNWSGDSNLAWHHTRHYLFANSLSNVLDAEHAALAWGDYDLDGDLDLALSGHVGDSGFPLYMATRMTRIYRNDSGLFYRLTDLSEAAVRYGSVAWADYDLDGYLDIAVCGEKQGDLIFTTALTFKLYKYNTDQSFSVVETGIPGLAYSSLAWGDYDSDGDPDLAVTGDNIGGGAGVFSRIYRNDKGVFTDMGTPLAAVNSGCVAWGDYDNDGDLDLALCGDDLGGGLGIFSAVYRNDSGTFIVALPTGTIADVRNGALAWADFNNDGFLDLALSGRTSVISTATITAIYKNNGDGSFSNLNAGFPGIENGSISWGDYDNDGDPDLAVSGPLHAYIYQNNGNETFTDISENLGIPGVEEGDISWGDYDNDTDLDFAICGGLSPLGRLTRIYRSDTAQNNDPPSAPVNLTDAYNKSKRQIELRWDKSSDSANKTPQDGLYYEVIIATEPTTGNPGKFVVSPTKGKGTQPFMGNFPHGYISVSPNTAGANIYNSNFVNNTTHYWQVRAIDTGFAKSNWSTMEEIYLPDVLEPQKVTSLNAVTGDMYGEIDLQWEMPGDDGWNGMLHDDSKFALQYSQNNDITWSTAAANIIISTSNVLPHTTVYMTITGLTGGNTYYFRVWYRDEEDNWSDVSNSTYTYAMIDFSAPATVTTLTALRGARPRTIELSWASPGENGFENPLLEGAKFELYLSSYNGGFVSTNTQLSVSTFGVTPYSMVSYSITGLNAGATYYIAMWYYDKFSNAASTSNIVWSDVMIDTIAPAAVTALIAVPGYYGNEAVLSWKAPGDDGWQKSLEQGAQFKIEFSTDQSEAWDKDAPASKSVIVSTYGLYPGTPVSYTITTLSVSSTYYFVLWHRDNALNWSSSSTVASAIADVTPPDPVSALVAQKGYNDGEIKLNWISSGDDGMERNIAPFSKFAVQKSSDPQAVWSLENASILISSDTRVPSSTITHFVTGLTIGTTYYIRVWQADERNNWSAISQGATSIPQGEILFVEILPGIPNLFNSCVSWADYDNDGDPDLAISGSTIVLTTAGFTRIYRNDNTVFQDINAGFEGVYNGSFDWGDYDNDGDLDLVFCGSLGIASAYITRVYRNDSYTFNLSTSVIGVSNGSVLFADFDNDGDLDLTVGGAINAASGITRIYRNNAGNFEDSFDLYNTFNGRLVWGDYDNDGDLDLFMCDQETTTGLTMIFRNENAGQSFTEIRPGINVGMNGSIALGDYDNDGDLDMVVAGQENLATRSSRIYNNDNGVFTEIITAALIGVQNSCVEWGDYDNDGFLDLLLGGDNLAYGTGKISKIYKNYGLGIFLDINAGIAEVNAGTLSWADYDLDGDLDIAVTGSNVTRFYRNDGANSNTAPTVPGSPSAAFNRPMKRIELTWNKSYDIDTLLQKGLYYDVRMASIPITNDLKNWVISVSTGYGKSPSMGNYSHGFVSSATFQAGLNMSVKNLLNFSTYYWQARSIDTGYKKSAWSSAQKIILDDVHPPFAVTSLSGGDGTFEGALTLHWNAPGDDLNVNNMKTGSLFKVQYSTYPEVQWGVASDYTRTVSTSGVVPGSLVSCSLTGLTPAVTYYMKIWHIDSYNNVSDLSNMATYWAQVDITPPAAITSIAGSAGDIEGDVDLSWNVPGDDMWIKTLSEGSQFKVQISTGDSNWDRNSAQRTVSTHSVVPESLVKYTVTGLASGTKYYFRVWYADEVSNWSSMSALATSYSQIDVTKPAKVTDLVALPGVYGGETKLTWSSPGDDGWEHILSTGSKFKVQYSTWNGGWNKDLVNAISTSSVLPYTQVSYLVTGLSAGSTYFFALWYADEGDLWSDMSSTSSAYAQLYDSIPPAQITSLYGQTGYVEGEIRLRWSAPGDDGNIGTLKEGSKYQIQYTTKEGGITWSTAAPTVPYIEISTSSVVPGTTIYYTLRDLLEGGTYQIRIWCQDEVQNWSVGSNTITVISQIDITPPSAITTLTVQTGGNEGEINLNWNIPGDDGWVKTLSAGSKFGVACEVNQFDVTNPGKIRVYVSTSGLAPGTNVNYTVTGLTEGASYYICVWTYDEKPNRSEPSNTPAGFAQYDVKPPAAVTEFTGEPGTDEGSVRLSWRMPGDNEWSQALAAGSVFRIQYSKISPIDWSTAALTGIVTASTNGVTPAALVAYQITGLENSSTYYFKIWHADERQNWSGISLTATAWIQLDTIKPGTVTTLASAQGQYGGSVLLNWNAPGDNGYEGILPQGSGFKVQYSSNDSGVTWSTSTETDARIMPVENVAPNSQSSYLVTGLSPGVTYYFRLWYHDEADLWSDISNGATNWAQLIDGSNPGAVTTLSAQTLPGEGSIKLSWNAPGDDDYSGTLVEGSAFYIQYSIDSNISWSTADVNISLSTSGVNPGQLIIYTVTGLSAGSTFYFKLWTKDEAGNYSGLSNSATALASLDVTPPSDITTLTAQTGVYESQAILNWISPGDDGFSGELIGGSQYRIVYDTVQFKVWDVSNAQVIISTGGIMPYSPISYTVTGLKGGATYYFSVWTYDDKGNRSGVSNTPVAWAQVDLLPPAAVNDLAAAPGGFPGEVLLTWSSSGDDGLNGTLTPGAQVWIEYSIVDSIWIRELAQIRISTHGVNPSAQVSYVVKNLPTGTTYYFKLWYGDEVPKWSEVSNLASSAPKEFAAGELGLTSITPDSGYDNETVNVTIGGTGFVPGMIAKLTKADSADITGSNTVVVSSTVITCSFDLGGKSAGAWNVEVSTVIAWTNYLIRLADGFTIVSRAATSEVFVRKDIGATISITPASGNITLEIPANGFREDVTITLSTDTVAASQQENIEPLSIGIRITTDKGIQPIKGLTVTVYYRDSDIVGIDESKLSLAMYDETWNRWVAVKSTVYPDQNKVVAVITHLSRFALVALKAAQNLDGVNVFPVPFNPPVHTQGMTIENLTAEAVIRIFTVSRELVREIKYSDGTGRTVWDGKNDAGNDVASGIYILYLKDPDGGYRRIKIAVEK